MDDWLREAIAGGVADGLGVLLITLFAKPKKCPECGTPAPKSRNSTKRRRMLLHGWTCPECGTEVDPKGRRIED